MDDSKQKVALVGNGAATAALMAAVAQFPIRSSRSYSGRVERKPQRMGSPKLTGKRLERVRKQTGRS